MAEGNWLGIAMPEAYGGAGLGITEAAVLMQAVAESGAAMCGASRHPHQHFRPQPGGRVRHRGAEAPHAAAADRRPGQGLFRRDRAQRRAQHHRRSPRAPSAAATTIAINGTKIWTSTAQIANKILLLARTTPLDKVKRKTHGLTLFYTDLDRAHVEVRLIHKMGRHAVDSNMLFFDGLRVPVEDRIGEEGEGFRAILARAESGARAGRRRSGRHRPRRAGARPPATRASAWCSAGRSARTRRSSTRWRGTGPNWKPPI